MSTSLRMVPRRASVLPRTSYILHGILPYREKGPEARVSTRRCRGSAGPVLPGQVPAEPLKPAALEYLSGNFSQLVLETAPVSKEHSTHGLPLEGSPPLEGVGAVRGAEKKGPGRGEGTNLRGSTPPPPPLSTTLLLQASVALSVQWKPRLLYQGPRRGLRLREARQCFPNVRRDSDQSPVVLGERY